MIYVLNINPNLLALCPEGSLWIIFILVGLLPIEMSNSNMIYTNRFVLKFFFLRFGIRPGLQNDRKVPMLIMEISLGTKLWEGIQENVSMQDYCGGKKNCQLIKTRCTYLWFRPLHYDLKEQFGKNFRVRIDCDRNRNLRQLLRLAMYDSNIDNQINLLSHSLTWKTYGHFKCQFLNFLN